MSYSNELVLGLEQEQNENEHLAVILLAKGCLVNAYYKPHAEHVDQDMDITHELLGHVVVGQPIEEAVDVETGCWVLDGASVPNQFAVIICLFHIDFRLLNICGQINLM